MPKPVGPFEVYEDYEGHLHIIDSTTRIVLDDTYAYDDSEDERGTRMGDMARALSIAYSPATQPRAAALTAEDVEALEFANAVLGASEKLFSNRTADPRIAAHMAKCQATVAVLTRLITQAREGKGV